VNTATAEAREIIQQVVRGERPWADLGLAGIKVRLDGGRCAVENTGQTSARVSIHDLAKGFLVHLHDPRALREWAFIMEGIDTDLDVENHPAGETLLTALWDASFGTPLSDDTLKTIESLANGNGGNG